MPSINLLIPKLATDFPTLRFNPGKDFYWSAQEKTIYYPKKSTDNASLLHELAHSILNHAAYSRDIQLIEIERDAWAYAVAELGPRYNVTITDNFVQNALDSYRDWLHARSTCPHCRATGMQSKANAYRCLACQHTWRVNEARTCGLKRTLIQN